MEAEGSPGSLGFAGRSARGWALLDFAEGSLLDGAARDCSGWVVLVFLNRSWVRGMVRKRERVAERENMAEMVLVLTVRLMLGLGMVLVK